MPIDPKAIEVTQDREATPVYKDTEVKGTEILFEQKPISRAQYSNGLREKKHLSHSGAECEMVCTLNANDRKYSSDFN